jgi:hypothetical protein
MKMTDSAGMDAGGGRGGGGGGVRQGQEAAAARPAKTFKLTYSIFFPADAHPGQTGMEWAAEVEKRSEGGSRSRCIRAAR